MDFWDKVVEHKLSAEIKVYENIWIYDCVVYKGSYLLLEDINEKIWREKAHTYEIYSFGKCA